MLDNLPAILPGSKPLDQRAPSHHDRTAGQLVRVKVAPRRSTARPRGAGLLGLTVASLLALEACQASPTTRYTLTEVSLTEHFPTGGYAVKTTLPPTGARPDLLPQGEAVCKRFGLGGPGTAPCSTRAVLAVAQKQTDPGFWFTNTETVSEGAPVKCPQGVPFERYMIPSKPGLVDYLCPASPQDDTITDQEVAAYEALGRRLRGIAQPTLAEFRAANDMKITIDTYARMAAEPAR